RVVPRCLEDDDVTPMRIGEQNAPLEQVQTKGERVSAISVAVFRDEEVIANEKRWDHGAGRDVERLEEKNANDDCNGNGLQEHDGEIESAALFLFLGDFRFHAHHSRSGSNLKRA